MWTTLSGHANLFLLGAGLSALGMEFVLIVRELRRRPPPDAVSTEPYLWFLFTADADPHVWATFVTSECAFGAGEPGGLRSHDHPAQDMHAAS